MALSYEWWKEKKSATKIGKQDSSKLGKTGEYEDALKTWDTARKKLDKSPTGDNYNEAKKALATVDAKRKLALAELGKLKFDGVDDLCAALSNESHITKSQTELDKVGSEIMLKAKLEKADPNEVVFEQLWHTYEEQHKHVEAAPSIIGYKTALASLGKLSQLADKCMETPYLISKYKKMKSGIESQIAKYTQDVQTYQTKINDAATRRKVKKIEFDTLEKTLTASKTRMDQIAAKLKAVAAGTDPESQTPETKRFNLIKYKKMGETESALALQAATNVRKDFAPGTVIRDATDIKGLHSDDVGPLVLPHTNALFEKAKACKTLEVQIKTIADQISQLPVG